MFVSGFDVGESPLVRRFSAAIYVRDMSGRLEIKPKAWDSVPVVKHAAQTLGLLLAQLCFSFVKVEFRFGQLYSYWDRVPTFYYKFVVILRNTTNKRAFLW